MSQEAQTVPFPNAKLILKQSVPNPAISILLAFSHILFGCKKPKPFKYCHVWASIYITETSVCRVLRIMNSTSNLLQDRLVIRHYHTVGHSVSQSDTLSARAAVCCNDVSHVQYRAQTSNRLSNLASQVLGDLSSLESPATGPLKTIVVTRQSHKVFNEA